MPFFPSNVVMRGRISLLNTRSVCLRYNVVSIRTSARQRTSASPLISAPLLKVRRGKGGEATRSPPCSPPPPSPSPCPSCPCCPATWDQRWGRSPCCLPPCYRQASVQWTWPGWLSWRWWASPSSPSSPPPSLPRTPSTGRRRRSRSGSRPRRSRTGTAETSSRDRAAPRRSETNCWCALKLILSSIRGYCSPNQIKTKTLYNKYSLKPWYNLLLFSSHVPARCVTVSHSSQMFSTRISYWGRWPISVMHNTLCPSNGSNHCPREPL